MSSVAEKPKLHRETVAEWSAPGTKVGDNNVIPGVKVLGFESPSHKRRYPIEAMRGSARMYEGAQVNFDHPAGLYDPSKKTQPRSATTAFGRIRNVRVDESRGLVGDLHYNPGHPFAGAVKWAAENDPGQYALSHLADLEGRYESGWFVTDKISKVHSVDVVSNGGTTAGLYESAATEEGDHPVEQPVLTSMTREAIQAARQDLKILTAAESLAQDTRLKELETKVTAAEAENKELKSKIEGFEAVTAKTTRDEKRLKLIGEAKLPEHLNTTTFQAMCMESSTTDERFTALLAERKELAAKTTGKVTAPRSNTKGVGESAGASSGPDTSTSKGFAAAIGKGK